MRKPNARRANRNAAFFIDVLESRVLLSASFDITGLTALRNDSAFSNITGQGVGIAVLDTGVDAANPELTPQVEAFYNAVEDPVSATTNVSPSNAVDNDGHGSHVSGIAASSNSAIGVAYGAKLVDIKVIPDANEQQLGGDPLLRGLEWVAANYLTYNIKVINMSLGESGVNDNTVTSADAQDAEAVEIKKLENLGITVVSAAGNSYAQYVAPGESFPAIVSTIAVGNTWANTGQASDFGVPFGEQGDNYYAVDNSATPDTVASTSQRSNVGNMILAPGEDIYSDWNGTLDSSNGSDLLHNTISGTSMASPFISGVVALMQQAAEYFGGHYIASTSEILQIIQQTGDTVVDSNNPNNSRYNSQTGATTNLPETGLTFQRVDVLKAIEEVEKVVTGGSITSGPAPGPDQNNTATTAIPVTNIDGTTVYTFDGNIGTDGLVEIGNNDVDLYQLNVVSPGQVTFTLSLPSGGTAFAADLRLFDASGNVIASTTGTAGAYPTLTTNGALAIGTYYLGISSVGNQSYTINGTGAANGMGQGDYALEIQLNNPDPNGTIQGAVPVDLTEPTESLQDPNTGAYYTDVLENGILGSDPPPTGSSTRITVTSDVDMFEITAPDSGKLELATLSDTFSGQATFMEVFDSTGKSLATSTSNPNSYNDENDLSVSVIAGDTYYLAVTVPANSGFNPTDPYIGRAAGATPVNNPQNYYLHLRFDNGDADGTALNANSANINGTVSASIGADNGVTVGANGSKDVDWYAYTANSNGLFDITAQSTTNGFTPVITLWDYASGGSSITKIADTSSSNLFASPSSLFSPDAVTPPGGAGSAHITFQVSAGQSFFVAVSGQGNDNFNWYALASGAGGQTGNYTLTSQLKSLTTLVSINDNSINNGTPESISVGQSVNGNIGADGSLVIGSTDVDMYKFVAPANDMLNIRTFTSQEGDADTVLRVFDASGNQLAANDNIDSTTTASEVTLSVQAGKTYYIGVDGAGTNAMKYNPLTGANSGSGSTGNYTLSVLSTTPGFTVTNPPAISALIGGNIVFTVTLSQPLSAAATVAYATADGTAIAGTDYTAQSGTLTFPAGTTSETISVPVPVNATAPTGSKTFTLTLSNPSSNAGLANAMATATIDEGALSPVQFNVESPTPVSNTSAGNMIFTVSLSQAATTAVTVEYATADGTAVAGADYTAETGTLTFPAGTTSQIVSVPVLANPSAPAGTRTFTLTLSNASANTSIVTSTATGTINDIVIVPQISITAPSPVSDASGGDLVFTVMLSQAATSIVTVDYATSDISATAGADYSSESGTLSFPAGTTSQTIGVPVLLNTNASGGAVSFSVTLSNPSNATLNAATATGTINDVSISTVNFNAKQPAKYVDSAGKPVQLTLAGPGSGTAVFVGGGSDPAQIMLDNTTAASTFTVRTAGATLSNITVNGSLLSLDAKSVSLSGNLSVTGSLAKLTLGPVTGGSGGGLISIAAAGAPSLITLGAVNNESLSTPGAIASLKVANWLNSLRSTIQISASNIASLTSLGDFAANVSANSLGTVKIGGSLTGDTFTAASINRLTIANGMSNVTLNLTGAGQTLPNLTVSKSVNNSQILSAGNIGKVTVGAFLGSNLFAGVDPSVTALPTSASDSTAADSIASFTVTAKTAPYSFSDSNIAAASIGDVLLARVNTNNNGASFGVATENLTAFTNRGVLKWTRKQSISLLAPDGDLVVSVLS